MLLRNFSGATEDLVVLYDDLDLPLRFRIRIPACAAMRAVTAAAVHHRAIGGAPFIGPSGLAGASRNGDGRLCFGTFQRSRIDQLERSSTARAEAVVALLKRWAGARDGVL